MIILAPGQGIRQKNLPGWRGFASSKNFPGGCPGGMYPVGTVRMFTWLFLNYQKFTEET